MYKLGWDFSSQNSRSKSMSLMDMDMACWTAACVPSSSVRHSAHNRRDTSTAQMAEVENEFPARSLNWTSVQAAAPGKDSYGYPRMKSRPVRYLFNLKLKRWAPGVIVGDNSETLNLARVIIWLVSAQTFAGSMVPATHKISFSLGRIVDSHGLSWREGGTGGGQARPSSSQKSMCIVTHFVSWEEGWHDHSTMSTVRRDKTEQDGRAVEWTATRRTAADSIETRIFKLEVNPNIREWQGGFNGLLLPTRSWERIACRWFSKKTWTNLMASIITIITYLKHRLNVGSSRILIWYRHRPSILIEPMIIPRTNRRLKSWNQSQDSFWISPSATRLSCSALASCRRASSALRYMSFAGKMKRSSGKGPVLSASNIFATSLKNCPGSVAGVTDPSNRTATT